MNRFLIPKISRQLLKIIIPLGASYFFIFLLMSNVLPTISYSTEGILLAVILPLFMGSSFYWILFFPSNKSRDQIIFLNSLPVSKKRISRNDIKIYLYVHACVISIILVTGVLLFLAGLLTGVGLLRVIAISIWFTITTLLSYQVSCLLKNSYMRFFLLTFTVMLIFFPLGFLLGISLGKTGNVVAVLLGVIACSVILTGVFLLVQRYNEKKFMNKDLI